MPASDTPRGPIPNGLVVLSGGYETTVGAQWGVALLGRHGTRAAAVSVALAVVAACVLVADPAGAHRGKIPQYTYNEGCKGFIDPIGILFYGRDASATRAADLSEDYYDGMKEGDDDSQYFVGHGNCLTTQKAVDDGGPVQDRTHMRIGGIRSPTTGRYARDGKNRIYSVGTPHTDDFILECRTHVNPPNGFRDARRRFAAAFRENGHKVSYQYLGNKAKRIQCDDPDRIAQGDGFLAKIRTTK
jgi:hypothetical protein